MSTKTSRCLPTRALAILAWMLPAFGCADEVPEAETWSCPVGWVAAERGGCGPAVLLCVPGGGAAVGACAGVDLARSPEIELPDGGSTVGFRRTPLKVSTDTAVCEHSGR